MFNNIINAINNAYNAYIDFWSTLAKHPVCKTLTLVLFVAWAAYMVKTIIELHKIKKSDEENLK